MADPNAQETQALPNNLQVVPKGSRTRPGGRVEPPTKVIAPGRGASQTKRANSIWVAWSRFVVEGVAVPVVRAFATAEVGALKFAVDQSSPADIIKVNQVEPGKDVIVQLSYFLPEHVIGGK